ncbi:MAG: R3H domain-containing nucleic acid-binding protein [Patescibacteria group bacterium]
MKNKEIQNLIKELLEKTNITLNDCVVDDSVFGENSKITVISIDVKEPHLFLSRDGEALHALNHLVKRMTEPKGSEEFESNETGKSFLIDINGFHKKRIDNIKAVVHMMAERARYFKSSVEVEPMSAFDRRIVHELLGEATDLATESQGTGLNRRVVIKYTGSL